MESIGAKVDPTAQAGGSGIGDKELAQKFRNNACRTLTWENTEKAINSIFELERVEDVSMILGYLSL